MSRWPWSATSRGGLGYVAILAACMLSSLSGSAVADAAALGALLVPDDGRGRPSARRLRPALVAAGGVIGPVIPPSIGFVLFGVVGGVSITKLFLAGIVPGLMLGVGLCCRLVVASHGERSREPAAPEPGARSCRAVIDGFWALMLPVIIIVGLRFGVFTPTEAAVVVAVYSLFVATFVYRELKLARALRTSSSRPR